MRFLDPYGFIHLGITEDRFLLSFQPIYEATGNREITGYEVYARLPCYDVPELLKLVYKDDLTRQRFSKYVYEKCLKYRSRLGRELKMSINFWPEDLCSSKFVDWILETTRKAGADPHSLCIEIMNSGNGSVPLLTDSLKRLKSSGFCLVLDNYGLYNSNLHRFGYKPDIVKADKMFVPNANDEDILKACRIIIYSAQVFNCKTAILGIETLEQYQMAKALGFDYVQGWFLSGENFF